MYIYMYIYMYVCYVHIHVHYSTVVVWLVVSFSLCDYSFSLSLTLSLFLFLFIVRPMIDINLTVSSVVFCVTFSSFHSLSSLHLVHTFIHVHVHVHTYIFVCVCVCVNIILYVISLSSFFYRKCLPITELLILSLLLIQHSYLIFRQSSSMAH